MRVQLTKGQSPTANVVTINGVRLLFSYETIVGFDAGNGWVVRENSWGPTTGKHMNQETGVKPENRIPADEFATELETTLGMLKRLG